MKGTKLGTDVSKGKKWNQGMDENKKQKPYLDQQVDES